MTTSDPLIIHRPANWATSGATWSINAKGGRSAPEWEFQYSYDNITYINASMYGGYSFSTTWEEDASTLYIIGISKTPGNNTTEISQYYLNCFSSTDFHYVSGNLYALVGDDASFSASGFFLNDTSLLDATSLDLSEVYDNIENCKSYCLSNLFAGCTNLLGGPVNLNYEDSSIPSYTLYRIYYDCSNMSGNVYLNGLNPGNSAYSNAFYGCKNLNAVYDFGTSSHYPYGAVNFDDSKSFTSMLYVMNDAISGESAPTYSGNAWSFSVIGESSLNFNSRNILTTDNILYNDNEVLTVKVNDSSVYSKDSSLDMLFIKIVDPTVESASVTISLVELPNNTLTVKLYTKIYPTSASSFRTTNLVKSSFSTTLAGGQCLGFYMSSNPNISIQITVDQLWAFSGKTSTYGISFGNENLIFCGDLYIYPYTNISFDSEYNIFVPPQYVSSTSSNIYGSNKSLLKNDVEPTSLLEDSSKAENVSTFQKIKRLFKKIFN